MTHQDIADAIQHQREIILNNETLLSNEDYKVIKCSEAKVSDAEMPYDTNDLIGRRNGYRASINAAQDEIERLEALIPDEQER